MYDPDARAGPARPARAPTSRRNRPCPGSRSNTRPPPKNDARHRTRLGVEALEDRTVPAVIFTDAYTLAMPGAPDAATVTVTVDATGGGYHWNYHVVNDGFDPSGAADIGMFAVPVGDPADVSGLGTSMGEWTGGVGELGGVPDQVFWTGGEFIDQIGVGEAADFWFTTPVTAVTPGTGFVADSGFAGQAAGAMAVPADPLVVTTELDNRVADRLTSLREAIDIVNDPTKNLGGVWKITFDPGLAGKTITMDSTAPFRQFELKKNVEIDAWLPRAGDKITVQRNPGTAVKHRIFQVNAGVTAILRQLVLTNGKVDNEAGGAVWSAGDLSVIGCEIRQNNATNSDGGGVAATAGSLGIDSCFFTGNSAAQGGAVFIGQGVSADIRISDIVLNTARTGGGMFIEPSTTATPTSVLLDDVNVQGNRADDAGGGIFASGAGLGATTTLVLADGTLIRNNLVTNAQGKGGGLYFGAGTLTLFGVTFQDNDAANGDGYYRLTGTSVTSPSFVSFVNDTFAVGP